MKKSWIDAHHHLWLYNKAEYEWIKPDMVGINRDYIINDLESARGCRRERAHARHVRMTTILTSEATGRLIAVAPGGLGSS